MKYASGRMCEHEWVNVTTKNYPPGKVAEICVKCLEKRVRQTEDPFDRWVEGGRGMNCPICGEMMQSVSALSYGCVNCQKLYQMEHGELVEHGEWPILETEQKRGRRLAKKVLIWAIASFWLFCWTVLVLLATGRLL